jgi:hypothetical protein
MIMQDVMAARDTWIQESPNEKTRKQREASDFLKFRDSQGRFTDFHSLRHTFVTNLCKAGLTEAGLALAGTSTIAWHN